MAVTPGSLNLSKMTRLDEVALRVMEGKLTPAQGAARIEKIDAASSPYGPIPTMLAYALASGAFAQLFGGGLREITLSLMIGGLTGLLALLAGRSDRVEGLFAPLAAFLSAFDPSGCGDVRMCMKSATPLALGFPQIRNEP